MKYLDLFSGIGGFPLGAYNAGWRFDEHYFSEVDKYATKVYRQRFPGAVPLGDIREIDAKALADANRYEQGGQYIKGREAKERITISWSSQEWFITGGFPCQDISTAGKGEGIGGSRSGLWFEMWRIIRALRPRWVIAENVGAITFRGLADVINSLAAIGYNCEWQDIRASDMGAPHRRERIWIVAYPANRGQTRAEWKSGYIRSESETGRNVADPSTQRLQNGNARENRQRAYSQLAGENSGRTGETWPTEPAVGRVAHGISNWVDRLKCLGNSIVPQIAELLFGQIGQINGRT